MSSHPSRHDYLGMEIYQTPEEVENIRSLVKSIAEVPGDLVEVGVFQGATSHIILEESKDKHLYMFDTFEGFPDKLSEVDSGSYFVGDCKASLDLVDKLFKGNYRVTIMAGVFPETGDVLKKKKLAFAHIDVDIYQSTKESLEYLLPKMSPGGIILVHDYPAHPGVKKALDESGLKLEVLGSRQAVIRI